MKKKLSIVILNSSQADPAPYDLMRNNIEKLHNQNINVVVCSCREDEENLPMKLKIQNEYKLMNNVVDSNLIKSQILNPKFPDFLKLNMIKSTSHKERIRFYELLETKNISYISLFKYMINAFSYFGNNILPHIKENSIIFCQFENPLGFFINISSYLQESFDYDVKLILLPVCSEYMKDFIDIVPKDPEGPKEVIEEIETILRSSTVPKIICSEDDNGNFYSEEFDCIINQAVNHVLTIKFTISNLNPDKEKIIIDLEGRIIDKKEGTISMKSDLLKKDIREKLGIDRRLLTIPDYKKNFLSQFSKITIETQDDSKVLATFPSEELEFIEKLVNNFELLKKLHPNEYERSKPNNLGYGR